MGVAWLGVGPDLLVALDRSGREPLGLQLQCHLRDAIRSGHLEAGERLPSSRRLASQLEVSRGLVVDCYEQLESEGYLTSLVGSGTQVATAVAEMGRIEPAPSSQPALEIDFEYGIPDLSAFPMRDWSWALQQACRTASSTDLGDELGSGSNQLRTVLAAYLRRVRGSRVQPGDLIICNGFRQGLNLVLRTLAGSGIDVVALEDPGPLDHPAIAARFGLEVVSIPVVEDGLDVDALAASPARAVVVTPAHQCPTGVLLSADRRHRLVDWARSVDGFIVEDDYDAEFRFDRRPVGSLQGLAPDRVIAVGSVSKTLAPSLRIGWLASPPGLLPALAAEKQLSGRGVPTLDQLALAALIESGRFDKHLRHMRREYARRRQALVDALAAHAPHVEIRGVAAGCHAALRLPDGADERHVVEQARQRSIGLYAMSRYRSTVGSHPPELVIGFGNVAPENIRRGIEQIADLLQPQTSGPPSRRLDH